MNNDIRFDSEITEEFKSSFDDIVKKSNSIKITSHFSPDDDSISSVLAVYYYLIEILKIDKDKVKIIYTGEKNEKWSSLKYFENIEFVDDIFNYSTDNDLLILLDGGGYKRFSRKDEMLNFSGKTICIDHHPVPSNQFDLHLVAKQYTSTSEIIYRLFYQNITSLEKDLCEIILLGLIGDTGSFRYVNKSNCGVYGIAERLISDGDINMDAFSNRFQKISKRIYQLLIKIMSNSEIKSIKNWPDFVFGTVDINYCIENMYTDNEISEASSLFTSYLRSVENVDWGMIITPRLHDNTHSVSFRSSPGSVVTREIGEKMGIGGGHDRASGGKLLTNNTKKAAKSIFDWMKKNKPSFS